MPMCYLNLYFCVSVPSGSCLPGACVQVYQGTVTVELGSRVAELSALLVEVWRTSHYFSPKLSPGAVCRSRG
jgi:hypothetical protein